MPLAFQPLTRLLSAFGTDRVLSSNRLQRLRAREWALAEEYASRIPHIPLFQHRTGQDDSALGTCSFAGLEVRPRRLIPTSHPAVSYVELGFRYRDPAGRMRAVNLGRMRLYARMEDPLWLVGKTHSVEAIRASEALRHAYFSRVFALMKAQSSCNRALGSWLAGNLLGKEGLGERDWLAMIQNFNHDIVARQTNGARGFEAFRTAIRGFDFNTGMPSFGPVSLRLSVRPHQREDGHYAQSVTSVLLGNRRGWSSAARTDGLSLSRLAISSRSALWLLLSTLPGSSSSRWRAVPGGVPQKSGPGAGRENARPGSIIMTASFSKAGCGAWSAIRRACRGSWAAIAMWPPTAVAAGVWRSRPYRSNRSVTWFG